MVFRYNYSSCHCKSYEKAFVTQLILCVMLLHCSALRYAETTTVKWMSFMAFKGNNISRCYITHNKTLSFEYNKSLIGNLFEGWKLDYVYVLQLQFQSARHDLYWDQQQQQPPFNILSKIIKWFDRALRNWWIAHRGTLACARYLCVHLIRESKRQSKIGRLCLRAAKKNNIWVTMTVECRVLLIIPRTIKMVLVLVFDQDEVKWDYQCSQYSFNDHSQTVFSFSSSFQFKMRT